MKIVFLCRSLDQIAGGVEYSMTQIMNSMAARGHKIILVTWDRKEAEVFFPLAPDIMWHKLDLGDPWKKTDWPMRFKRLSALRKLITDLKPDCVVGFHDYAFIPALAALIGLSIPTIAAERNPVSRFEFSIEGLKKSVMFLLMARSKRITVFFERFKQHYPVYLRAKIRAVPNMIFPQKQLSKPEGGSDECKKTILTVGRLEYQKNPQILLQAFAALSEKHTDWNLIFVGEGSLRPELEAMITEYKLQERVQLTGAIKNPHDYFKAAQIFCFPSRWEGFGNALAEALSFGLPCVGFEKCPGVADLIQHEKSGILVEGNENLPALTKTLERLMSNSEERQSMGAQAAHSVEQYSPQAVFDRWEEILEGASK